MVELGYLCCLIKLNKYEFSYKLKQIYIGCSMNGTIRNHLTYADDTRITASSSSALQKLLNIYADFAATNVNIFNECFKPN